ncbi:MAG: FhaA domain-containing protein [Dehalococcoidia bacterium]
MTEHSRLERFFERAAGLGLGAELHPAALIQQVRDAAFASVNGGAVANAYTVSISQSDFAGISDHFGELREAVLPILNELAATGRLTRPGPWAVEFEASRDLAPGQSIVRAFFRNPHTPGAMPSSTRTKQIKRYRNAFLTVQGVGRVRLTHTPFTIGRAPDCDLAIPDLEISRRHARIEATRDGFHIRDLGSRNGIEILGETVHHAILVPGVPVRLGSTDVTLEVES